MGARRRARQRSPNETGSGGGREKGKAKRRGTLVTCSVPRQDRSRPCSTCARVAVRRRVVVCVKATTTTGDDTTTTTETGAAHTGS